MTGQELWASLLQEAIQGRLVEQRDDEPDVPQIGETPEDVPFAIPDKWKWVKLVSVCNSMKYGTAKKSKTAGLIPVIRMGNIQQGEIVWDNLVYTDDKEDIDKYELSENDILFNRTNSPELVGKTAIYRGERKAIYAGYLINIKYDRNIILGEYLNYILNSSIAKKYCDAVKTNGVCQANINAKKIGGFVFPLPPLDEQRRIVARLEELRPLVDEYGKAETELSKLNADLPERVRTSLLQEAISGRLVEQRDDEPDVPQIGDAPEDVPFAIPEKWKWVTLKNCVEFNPKIEMTLDNDVSFIPMADVAGGYENTITQVQTKKWKEVKTGFSKFADGDVIFAKITPCFQNRKSAICKNLVNGFGAGSTEFHVMRATRRIDSHFLLLLVKSDYFINYGIENFKGTAGQKRIGTKDAQNCPIPLPPIAEQGRIVARLRELMPEVAQLKR